MHWAFFSTQSFVVFSFHLPYSQSESWQEAAFALMAQIKSHLVKGDLQRWRQVKRNQQRMLKHPGAGHSRRLVPPLGPKGQGEKSVVTAQRGLQPSGAAAGLERRLPRGSCSPRDAETRSEGGRHILASPSSHPSIS